MNYIDNRLGTLIHTVGEDLLLTAEHWNGFDADTRVSTKMEWLNDMHEIEGLEGNYARGEMNASQEERYRRLKANLAKHLPIVRRLGLETPAVAELGLAGDSSAEAVRRLPTRT